MSEFEGQNYIKIDSRIESGEKRGLSGNFGL
jgi:hypothetical protein